MTATLINLAEEQIHDLHSLLASNGEYYAHMNETIDLEKTKRMLSSLPPGAEAANKSNMAYVVDGKLVGFVEVIGHYPDPGTAMIGLLIIGKEDHGRGLGSELLQLTLQALRSEGIGPVFLSYASTSEQARRFWERHGFAATGDVDSYEDLELVAMEKML